MRNIFIYYQNRARSTHKNTKNTNKTKRHKMGQATEMKSKIGLTLHRDMHDMRPFDRTR